MGVSTHSERILAFGAVIDGDADDLGRGIAEQGTRAVMDGLAVGVRVDDGVVHARLVEGGGIVGLGVG